MSRAPGLAVVDARLNELIRRIDRLDRDTVAPAALRALDELTDAKFVRYDTVLSGQAEKVALALASVDKSKEQDRIATEKRFESVNEFRQTLTDQTASFMPRTEVDGRLDGLTARMEAAASSIAERIERVSHDVDILAKRIEKTEGRSEGVNAGWGYLLGAVGFLATLIAIVTGVILVVN